jgi:isoleucyl-tRNA synthetase
VLSADFVTTTDGTGVVHTAVIYGEDDYQLGLKEGLPMVPLLNPNGTYNADAPEFLHGQYIKKAEAVIKADLESRGLLFAKESNTHSYPHCYRCGTALIYNAVSSWFINIQKVKEKMLSENEKITWFPEHLKHGRFKKIIETAPDWTISRNRFWASPLPIWKDAAGNVTVVGSLDELKARTKKSGNRYFAIRHGESEKNVLNIIDSDVSKQYALTEKGIAEVKASAEALKGKGIDVIITSPFLRTRETAAVVAETLGLTNDSIVVMDDLQELKHGVTDGGVPSEYSAQYRSTFEGFLSAPEGGETFADLKQRMGRALYEVEGKYQGKNILFVSHGDPIAALLTTARGAHLEEAFRLYKEVYPKKGEVVAFDFVPLPHNKNYELDFHLPYIDGVHLENEQGEKLTRIPEVVDCWVESGAMPFAEYHYPFENKNEFEKRAPGDFVSEYIGQTRAWFYYMHAISVQLFGRASFRNVVTTGTILAKDGEKLSKSKKNYTDPYVIFDTYGADAFRYYLMSSVVMQAEDLQFKDDDVKEVQNRLLNILRNTYAFYELYKDEVGVPSTESQNVLDRWILSRLGSLQLQMTEAFDRYDAIRATRPVREFVEDFSTWYLRRSRDRMKGDDAEDKKSALSTMRYVFLTFSKLIAPVMPFIAEEIYQNVKEDGAPESVHLTLWPEAKNTSLWKLFGFSKSADSIISDMAEVRRVVSLGLEKRAVANIKVRQPLSEVRIKSKLLSGKSALIDLIRDELNVKRVAIEPAMEEEVVLDTEISPELKEEGMVRDVLRFIQDLRKQAGLNPKDLAVLFVDEATRVFVETHWTALSKTTNLTRFEVGGPEKKLVVEGFTFSFDVGRA